MSGKFTVLLFFLLEGYLAINLVFSEKPPYEKAVYDTATVLISSTKPPTVAGTLWCGAEKNTGKYSHLGEAEKTDKCCRTWHDCDEFMTPGEEKYGLHNTANYKVYLCHCNEMFHQCLKDVTGLEASLATQIGMAYFDVVSPKCLKKMYYERECDVSFYDQEGNTHDSNPDNDFFCPKLVPTMLW
uniref:phospholipase A2 n=1 Tax=Eumenes pomiformis TaxID=693051 RepID=D1MEJ5_EUMPO|nr:PLA2 protein precursor [Eumenes pomiformis]